ncbi:tetratricopeptide repeat protein [Campylobacter pinnipediorum]|uniref:tetratricopeptide repeat protein n=1 Tax=Campylobacter pinnipediorum TaxID=1965231 RepID=UPI00084DD961|nr:hypothetical protein [Campylobacter pinnipediorum]
MIKNIFSLAVISSIAAVSFAGEVSVFNAGNLDTANPYGLTESEKEVLKNKHNVATLESNLNTNQEQIQGLQSIVESLSARIYKLEQRLNDIDSRMLGDLNSSNTSFASLKEYVEETRKIQEKNYTKITKTLKQLGALIDKKESDTKQQKKVTPKPKKDNFSGKNNNDIFKNAVKLFNENKLDDSKEHFEHLLSKNTKLATSNFYLGEIEYKNKIYANAIAYYQKSIEMDDKASYLPKLLYHTAISFDKVGDTSSANRFYKALKIGYPETKEAQASPDRK